MDIYKIISIDGTGCFQRGSLHWKHLKMSNTYIKPADSGENLSVPALFAEGRETGTIHLVKSLNSNGGRHCSSDKPSA